MGTDGAAVIGRPDQKGSTGRDNRMFVEGVLWIVRAVCTENLNPNVLTMKSAQYGARIYDAGSLNLARDRRIFVQ